MDKATDNVVESGSMLDHLSARSDKMARNCIGIFQNDVLESGTVLWCSVVSVNLTGQFVVYVNSTYLSLNSTASPAKICLQSLSVSSKLISLHLLAFLLDPYTIFTISSTIKSATWSLYSCSFSQCSKTSFMMLLTTSKSSVLSKGASTRLGVLPYLSLGSR